MEAAGYAASGAACVGEVHEICEHINRQISLRGIADTICPRQTGNTCPPRTPAAHFLPGIFLNGHVSFLALVVCSADCVLHQFLCRCVHVFGSRLSQNIFANTRLHLSSVENRDVTLADERKDIRLHSLPLQPGLRGRGVQVGHLCCARFERAGENITKPDVSLNRRRKQKTTSDQPQMSSWSWTSARHWEGQRIEEEKLAHVKANETEAQIEVRRIDLETLAITSAAENEAVCHDRSQQAARNQNWSCKKH